MATGHRLTCRKPCASWHVFLRRTWTGHIRWTCHDDVESQLLKTPVLCHLVSYIVSIVKDIVVDILVAIWFLWPMIIISSFCCGVCSQRDLPWCHPSHSDDVMCQRDPPVQWHPSHSLCVSPIHPWSRPSLFDVKCQCDPCMVPSITCWLWHEMGTYGTTYDNFTWYGLNPQMGSEPHLEGKIQLSWADTSEPESLAPKCHSTWAVLKSWQKQLAETARYADAGHCLGETALMTASPPIQPACRSPAVQTMMSSSDSVVPTSWFGIVAQYFWWSLPVFHRLLEDWIVSNVENQCLPNHVAVCKSLC